MRPSIHPSTLRSLATTALALHLAACAASTAEAPPGGAPSPAFLSSERSEASAGQRPNSLAILRIREPKRGARVRASAVHIVLALKGARVIHATTSHLRPDEGHVHLYVDDVLVSMDYGLEQDLDVHQGIHVIKAEFVAADHAPFSPRVWSPEVSFTVS